MIKKLICEKCKHQWLPRMECPLECPNCKTRKWKNKELKEGAENVQ